MIFRIDLKIIIFLIVFYFTRQIEIYSYLMLFAIIHEVGHLIAGLLLGLKPEKIELIPVGLSIAFKVDVKDINKTIKKANLFEIKKILVAFAGPLTNFFIVIITLNLGIDVIKGIMIIYTNFLIIIFNLLPIYPLDGGRIIKGFLHIFVGKQNAEKYIMKISKIFLYFITIFFSVMILYIYNCIIFMVYCCERRNKI